jgi:hypothetical protein
MMEFRGRLQLAEALGATNRWFCSQAHGRRVEDRELLISYYIKSGGALDFALRFEEAMGDANRWYCSQFYGRDIRDPATLWDYYTNYAPTRATGDGSREESEESAGELCGV